METLLTPSELLVVMMLLSFIGVLYLAYKDGGIKNVIEILKVLGIICWCIILVSLTFQVVWSREPAPINITGE